ncbi:MAG: glycosyltransferase family 2 protein [bacterium]|jgi:glycosyltransferase involved in cell wall biosynthesis
MIDYIPLTIIIPCYARQRKLERALASIFSQDLQPAEVLVIDDASSEPLIIPETLADAGRTRLIRLNCNAGPAKGRNTGMAAARTQWVSFLDSDDWLLPGSLRERWNYIQTEESRSTVKNCTVYGCGWQDVLPEGTIFRQRFPIAPKEPVDFFRGCWFAPGSCIIFNQEALLRKIIPFDENLRRLEDYEWFTRIALAGFNLKIQQHLGVAIERGNNTNLAAVAAATVLIRQRVANRTADRRLRRISDSYLFYECAASAWRERRLLRFAYLMARSILASPRLTLSPIPGWRAKPLEEEARGVK